MNFENRGTLRIPTRDGTQMIEVTPDEYKEYLRCLQEKRSFKHLMALVGGIAASFVIPVKAQTPVAYYGQKILAGFAGLSIGAVIGEVRNVISCAPILEDIVNSKANELKWNTPPEEKDEPSTKEILDFTPSISSHDLNNPINFNSDISSEGRTLDTRDLQESGGKTGAAKKRLTYDDLWRQHKESSDERLKARDHSSEGTDKGSLMENEPSVGKKKIRTNKYGDPLE